MLQCLGGGKLLLPPPFERLMGVTTRRGLLYFVRGMDTQYTPPKIKGCVTFKLF